MNEVKCILTSSGRFDLLRITLESFFKHNTYPINEFLVCDDSSSYIPEDLKKDFHYITWIFGEVNKNQIASLDYLWRRVTTTYAFTMEDDWEFLRPGFIEASMEVLQQDEKILQVWLSPVESLNQHPIDWDSHKGYGLLKSSGGVWAGTRFNPALKRKCDYDLIAPFSQHTTWDPAKPWKSEADISKVYHKLGFKGAILPDQYIKHIGENRHVG